MGTIACFRADRNIFPLKGQIKEGSLKCKKIPPLYMVQTCMFSLSCSLYGSGLCTKEPPRCVQLIKQIHKPAGIKIKIFHIKTRATFSCNWGIVGEYTIYITYVYVHCTNCIQSYIFPSHVDSCLSCTKLP